MSEVQVTSIFFWKFGGEIKWAHPFLPLAEEEGQIDPLVLEAGLETSKHVLVKLVVNPRIWSQRGLYHSLINQDEHSSKHSLIWIQMVWYTPWTGLSAITQVLIAAADITMRFLLIRKK